MGAWEEAQQELKIARKITDKYGVSVTNFVCVVRAYIAQRELFLKKFDQAIKIAHEALALSKDPNRNPTAGERDVVDANRLLGTAYRASRDLEQAENHLSEALTRCRAINLVEMEANILLELAKLSFDYGLVASAQDKAQKHFEEAKTLAEEALLITERSGYVLQGADVHLFLAQYALEQEKDKEKAKELAERAKELATCDGPPYYYKVAYKEAERMLERLKD
jgi:tetratricopeptide (TPR) repeat protein